jgi:putative ABC transport system permease protein
VLKSAGPNSSANTGHRNLIRGVTVAQTALTLALLVGAGLLIRTMVKLSEVKSGYETSRIVTMSVATMQNDWAAFHRLALQRVSALPGVEGAAFAWGVPLTGNDWQAIPVIEGQPVPAKLSDRTIFPVRAVTPGYFSLMHMSLLSGRDFRDTDTRDNPGVSIVNQAFVDRYFPGTSVLGRKLWWQDPGKEPSTEIIGVIENSRTDDLTRPAEPEIYSSLWQNSAFTKHLVVRSKGDPRSIMASIRGQLLGIDATVGVDKVQTMDQIRDNSLASRTFAMQLLAGFAVIASVLTLVGIYGVLSLSVANRRREIAIRAAVGAGRSQIRGLVFGEGVRLVGAGIIGGIVIALFLSRALRAFLYEVTPTDPATLVIAVTLFAAVAMAACWVPMRRAERVAPVEILRQE